MELEIQRAMIKDILYDEFVTADWPDRVRELIINEDSSNGKVWHTKSREHMKFYLEVLPLGNYAWKRYGATNNCKFKLLKDDRGVDGVVLMNEKEIEQVQITATYYNSETTEICRKLERGEDVTTSGWVGEEIGLIKKMIMDRVTKKIRKGYGFIDTLLVGTRHWFVATILRNEYCDLRMDLVRFIKGQLDSVEFENIALVDVDFVGNCGYMLISN